MYTALWSVSGCVVNSDARSTVGYDHFCTICRTPDQTPLVKNISLCLDQCNHIPGVKSISPHIRNQHSTKQNKTRVNNLLKHNSEKLVSYTISDITTPVTGSFMWALGGTVYTALWSVSGCVVNSDASVNSGLWTLLYYFYCSIILFVRTNHWDHWGNFWNLFTRGKSSKASHPRLVIQLPTIADKGGWGSNIL